MNFKRGMRFIILVALLLFPVVAQAQAPTSVPSPARSLSDNISELTQRAASLLPYFESEIVSKLIGWFELLAWVMGNVLAGFAMLRIIREDNGEGPNLFWWFGRLVLFFVLSGTSFTIINTMSAVGHEIANGNESGQQSVLQSLYLAQRDSFHDSYGKFQQNMFTVKVDGRETAIEPVPLGSESVLGILVDTESTIQDFDRKADVSQWNISTMMTWLNFERALIEFGDLVLVILAAAEAVPPEVPIVRPALSGGFQNAAIGNRNQGVNQTADIYREGVTGLQNTAASKSVSSSQQYESDMKVAIDRQAGEQIAGVNAGAGQAIGGYQRGAAQARSGVDQNYGLELGANKQIYVTQVDAAGQIRNAGLEAAKLRQAAAVIAAVGREISREVGQGMRIRF